MNKKAMRFNEGKPELDYLYTWYHALCEVAEVCQKGAEKYKVGNYLLGQDYRQLLGSSTRHIAEFGHPLLDDYDTESNRHHIAHAIWNLLQLLQLEVGPSVRADGESNQVVFDNRIRPPSTVTAVKNACCEIDTSHVAGMGTQEEVDQQRINSGISPWKPRNLRLDQQAIKKKVMEIRRSIYDGVQDEPGV